MENEQGTGWRYKFKAFVNESLRVLKITKKPTGTEFKTIVKVSGLGILAIGLLGFIIQMTKLLFF